MSTWTAVSLGVIWLLVGAMLVIGALHWRDAQGSAPARRRFRDGALLGFALVCVLLLWPAAVLLLSLGSDGGRR